MDGPQFVTKEEKQQLQTRLDELIANRPAISKRIQEARDLGDLKENGDYHAAREEQGMQEAEIKRLTDRISHSQVVDEAHKSMGVVFVGAMVRIREVGGDEIEVVKLVGESSGGDSMEYMEVTLSSPFGEALLKARVGETISVRGPRGMKRFEIVELA